MTFDEHLEAALAQMPRVTGRTMTTTTQEWWFGRKAPTTAPCAWGARAIYGNEGYIDLLHDRQQGVGGDTARKMLAAFLDSYALPRLRFEFPQFDGNVFEFEHDGWHVEASTHRNSGYLYIGVWPVGGEVPQYESKPYGAKERVKRTKRPMLSLVTGRMVKS